MTKEEILHLGTLARIRLSDEEVEQFEKEIDGIVAYVGAVNEVVAERGITKQVGVVHNVFRKDEVTNEPGTYTKRMLKAMPQVERGYLKVKKILNPDS